MRLLKLFCAGLVIVILSTSITFAQGPQPGEPSIGDPYYPEAGNGGYDVQHYLLDLTVDVEDNVLDGIATIDAAATEDLSAFNFDLSGLDVKSVTVDGADATFAQDGETELTITPAESISTGDTFTVVIEYGGTPEPVQDPSLEGSQLGWVDYSGGTYVTSEPLGSSSWYPVNDHPSDKATYTFRVTVPEPYIVAANGVLTDTTDNGDTQTFVWEMDDPMASYLATVNVAEFAIETEEGPNGLPIRNYFPADIADEVSPAFAGTSEWIAIFEELYGPYPFDAYGVVVIDTGLGFALETQTISLFSASNVSDDFEAMPGLLYASLVAGHELSHQWFGNSLTPARWQDIWLNEGFATYSEVLMVEHVVSPEDAIGYIQQIYLTLLIQEIARDPEITVGEMVELIIEKMGQDVYDETIAPMIGDAMDTIKDMPAAELIGSTGLGDSEPVIIGDPGSDALFSIDVYYRGGMTLHALRTEVGDEVFFNILRTYVERYSYSNVTTEDFIAVAEEVSGMQLDDLFDQWLFQAELPPLPQLGE